VLTESLPSSNEEEKAKRYYDDMLDHVTCPQWKEFLVAESKKEYFVKLLDFLNSEHDNSKIIFPTKEDIFTAFNFCPLDKIKVVILGQDPYHNVDQAHGLSFSVRKGITIPPSLSNIYKELSTDIPEFTAPNHGNLTKWAEQGVFMLNTVLTVQAHLANSHANKGWEILTNNVIKMINAKKERLVFLLWGKHAQQKDQYITKMKHCVLKSSHPSPFSCHSGFFGSKPFSGSNKYLQKHKIEPIDWKVICNE